MQYRKTLEKIELDLEDGPVFEVDGKTWKLTALVLKYSHTGRREAWWSGTANRVRKDGEVSSAYREIGGAWGSTPEVNELMEALMAKLDPRKQATS